jgi:hypothetical protein
MITKSFEVSGRILLKLFPDDFFISNGTPEETDVGTSTLSHVIQSMIKCLFLGYKPFVDF